jgi:hypothetical protein
MTSSGVEFAGGRRSLTLTALDLQNVACRLRAGQPGSEGQAFGGASRWWSVGVQCVRSMSGPDPPPEGGRQPDPSTTLTCRFVRGSCPCSRNLAADLPWNDVRWRDLDPRPLRPELSALRPIAAGPTWRRPAQDGGRRSGCCSSLLYASSRLQASAGPPLWLRWLARSCAAWMCW